MLLTVLNIISTEVATLNFTGGQTMTKFIFVTGGVVSSLEKESQPLLSVDCSKIEGLKLQFKNLIHI